MHHNGHWYDEEGKYVGGWGCNMYGLGGGRLYWINNTLVLNFVEKNQPNQLSSLTSVNDVVGVGENENEAMYLSHQAIMCWSSVTPLPLWGGTERVQYPKYLKKT